MASNRWKIGWILKKKINNIIPKFTSEIGHELQKVYEESLEEWWEPFVKWSNNKHSESSFSFLRAASSAYGNENFGAMPDGDNFKAELEIIPSKMNAGLIHEWGSKSGKPFSDEDAFDITYVKGVFGFNRGIVKNNWFKTKKSRNKIIAKYNFKKDLTREQLINKITDGKRHIVPPKSRKTPDKIMQGRVKQIFSKKHLDEVMGKYLSSDDFTKGLSSNFIKI